MRCFTQQPLQIFHLANRLPTEFDDDISAVQATPVGRAIAHEAEDDHPLTRRLPAPLRGAWGILDKHPEVATALSPSGLRPAEQQTLDNGDRQYGHGASCGMQLSAHGILTGINAFTAAPRQRQHPVAAGSTMAIRASPHAVLPRSTGQFERHGNLIETG
jgi:hypothetical protein